MKFEWVFKENKISVKYLEQEFYFIVPNDFKQEHLNEKLLNLAEILLFSPWEKETLNNDVFRDKGKNIGLSFSGGVDSTACIKLLPKDKLKLAYMQRDYKSSINHTSALKFCNDVGSLVVKSNHELIRENYGLMNGFSTDFACLVHLVILADYLDLGYVAAGTVLESAYLRNGYEFRNFNETKYWKKWSSLFERAGINLILPVAGLSEVLTTKIVNKSEFKELAQSCLRAEGGCNNCYKCYRKNSLSGKNAKMNKETEISIKKRPPKMASSIIYAMNKYNLDIFYLREFKDLDVSFLEAYYPDSISLLPKELRKSVKEAIEHFAPPMNKDQINKIKKFDLSEYA